VNDVIAATQRPGRLGPQQIVGVRDQPDRDHLEAPKIGAWHVPGTDFRPDPVVWGNAKKEMPDTLPPSASPLGEFREESGQRNES
jgi:hypothetical protein